MFEHRSSNPHPLLTKTNKQTNNMHIDETKRDESRRGGYFIYPVMKRPPRRRPFGPRSLSTPGNLGRSGSCVMLSMAEASLSVTLALRLHITSLEGAEGVPSSVFDERLQPLCADHHDDTSDEEDESGSGIQSIFSTISRLLCALDVRHEPEVLVSALILIERVVAAMPGVLSPHTWRPLLTVAVVVSAKRYLDEMVSDMVFRLKRHGFATLDRRRLYHYELAFLDCIGWNVEVSRRLYTTFGFALRDLLSTQIKALEDIYPEVIKLARALGSTREHLAASPYDMVSPAHVRPRTPPAVCTWQHQPFLGTRTLTSVQLPRRM